MFKSSNYSGEFSEEVIAQHICEKITHARCREPRIDKDIGRYVVQILKGIEDEMGTMLARTVEDHLYRDHFDIMPKYCKIITR